MSYGGSDKKEAVMGMLSISTEPPEISMDQFIEDTTSSFLCISWRQGDEGERAELERLLNAFETASTKDVMKKLDALDNLTAKARQLNVGSLKNACGRIMKNGYILRDQLTDSEEYKRVEAEKKQKAIDEEQQRLDGLTNLSLEQRIEAFTKQYSNALLPTLLAGTDGLEGGAKVLKLTENFKNIGFTYTMKSSSFKALLGGKVQGDCSTLSHAMAAICNEIFLINAAVAPPCADLLVPSTERTIDGAKAPNAEGGAFWVFDNHYWVKAGGNLYDPLFGRAFSNEGWHPLVRKYENKDLGITVENYGDEYRMVLLFGAGNKLIGNVTLQDWENHKAEIAKDKLMKKVTATFEEMKKRVLA
jgi:hypothetical protein